MYTKNLSVWRDEGRSRDEVLSSFCLFRRSLTVTVASILISFRAHPKGTRGLVNDVSEQARPNLQQEDTLVNGP